MRRKYVATSLRECQRCWLRFRVPKDDDTTAFYQKAYSEGFGTNLPTDSTLKRLLETRFRDTEKDFFPYIELIRSQGLSSGDVVVDFGASWGYGSWQMQQAGFDVYSYEISLPRARFAREKLGCKVIDSLSALPGKAQCLFSAHVIEHLPDPNVIWTSGKAILEHGGFIACFCPNGNPETEDVVGLGTYDQLWGKVHPLLITPRFLQSASARHGFDSDLSSSPYQVEHSDLHGSELCLIARRHGYSA